MQISQKELKSLGINLEMGRYTKKTSNGKAEIYKCGGDTEGCILLGLERTSIGVARSQDAMKILMPLIGHAIDRSEPVELEII